MTKSIEQFLDEAIEGLSPVSTESAHIVFLPVKVAREDRRPGLKEELEWAGVDRIRDLYQGRNVTIDSRSFDSETWSYFYRVEAVEPK